MSRPTNTQPGNWTVLTFQEIVDSQRFGKTKQITERELEKQREEGKAEKRKDGRWTLVWPGGHTSKAQSNNSQTLVSTRNDVLREDKELIDSLKENERLDEEYAAERKRVVLDFDQK